MEEEAEVCVIICLHCDKNFQLFFFFSNIYVKNKVPYNLVALILFLFILMKGDKF